MRKGLGYVIRAAVLVLTAWFLHGYAVFFLKEGRGNWEIRWTLAAGLLLTGLVLFIKAVRFYFVVLEKRLSLPAFIRLYFETALVSIVLPFKAGELYRMYSFGEKLNDLKTGCLLVLVDRYFDTVPLMALLAGGAALGTNQVPGVVWLLFLFLAMATAAYMMFPSSYRYANQFLMVNVESPRGLAALGVLRKLKQWFLYLRELIRGRELILLFLSTVSWLTEYAAFGCLMRGLGFVYSAGDFIAYIDSVLTAEGSLYGRAYDGIRAVILVVAIGTVWAMSLSREKREA